jgi:LPXTG-site transpeptidase (sortase) family protein
MKGFIRLAAIVTSLLLAAPFAVHLTEASDATTPQAPAPTQAEVYSSGGDRLIIPSLQTGDAGRCGGSALNAVVNVYDVGSDLQMGEPIADCDVVRQNFAAFPGVGGYPGDGGTTTLAGHVDYHPNYQAVFWYLRNIQVGAEIQYQRADGRVVKYTVDWAGAVSDPNYDWGALVASGGTESIVLITCDGVFNPATHEYSNRFVAHGVIAQ